MYPIFALALVLLPPQPSAEILPPQPPWRLGVISWEEPLASTPVWLRQPLAIGRRERKTKGREESTSITSYQVLWRSVTPVAIGAWLAKPATAGQSMTLRINRTAFRLYGHRSGDGAGATFPGATRVPSLIKAEQPEAGTAVPGKSPQALPAQQAAAKEAADATAWVPLLMLESPRGVAGVMAALPGGRVCPSLRVKESPVLACPKYAGNAQKPPGFAGFPQADSILPVRDSSSRPASARVGADRTRGRSTHRTNRPHYFGVQAHSI